jgi:hypothetical protein
MAKPFWEGLAPHQRNGLRAVAQGARQLTGQDAGARYDLRSGGAVTGPDAT